MRKNPLFALAFGAVVLTPGMVSAQSVLNFQDVPNGDFYTCYEGGYTSGNFHLQTESYYDGMCGWGDNSLRPGNPGSASLFANYVYDTTTLTRTDSNPFSLYSIDLAHIYNADLGALTVYFTGTRSDLSQVFASFLLPEQSGVLNPPAWHYNFSADFNDLVSVTWSDDNTGSYWHQFDNLCFSDNPQDCPTDALSNSVTPEPVTMTLLGTGLVGLAGARRRKKAAAATTA